MFTLVPDSHPILSEPTPPFDFENPPADPKWLVGEMLSTMKRERGIGLAAPQVNLPYRMFVMETSDGRQIGVFNPEILSVSETKAKDDEGCLSFPGLFLKVSRPITAEVRYQDAAGNLVNEMFANLDARCYLHETDHLNGVTFVSLVSRLVLSRAKGSGGKTLRR
jgi:peptide deformylase